jgi:hypothetical protein
MTHDTGSAEVRPEDLTSPHTVHDPELERQRAEEAAERERESRETSETKFEQLREQQEAERSAAAEAIADVPAPTE